MLRQATGYPVNTLDAGIRGLFGSMDTASLLGWLTAAGIRPAQLDGPPTGPGIWVLAPRLTAVIASGNLPGAAVPSLVQALLLKSPVLAKASGDEPVLLPLYARSVAEIAPELKPFLAVHCWAGGNTAVEDAVAATAGALVAYGGNAAIASWRRRLRPNQRFLAYGHRISLAAISREWLTHDRAADTAARAARDASTYDQQGCLSPRWFFVESGGEVSPPAWMDHLAAALAAEETTQPRRTLSAGGSAALHQFRATVEMQALAQPDLLLRTSRRGTTWTAILDPRCRVQAGPLDRTLLVYPVEDLADVPALVETWRDALISASLGVEPGRLPGVVNALTSCGITRFTALGQAQTPQEAGFHDGLGALAALARYVVWEPESRSGSAEGGMAAGSDAIFQLQ